MCCVTLKRERERERNFSEGKIVAGRGNENTSMTDDRWFRASETFERLSYRLRSGYSTHFAHSRISASPAEKLD